MSGELRRFGRGVLLGLMWLGHAFWPVLPHPDPDEPVLPGADPDEPETMPSGRGVFSRWP